jgi:2-haloalkanoic acid dehalogenase type II
MKLTDFTTLTFDCYGTLIDWETGILAVLKPWAARNRLDASDDALLEAFGRHETGVQQANPGMLYRDILRRVQRAVAKDFAVAPSDADADALGTSIGDWPAFPDSVASLAYLKQHYKLVILSNVDNASFAHSNARLRVAFDAIFTAEDIGSYKPDPRNFRYMLDRLGAMGVARVDILHTAQSLYHDIPPAKELGLATNWINRRHAKTGEGATPPSDVRPDFDFPSLAAFAEAHRVVRSA